MAASRIIERQTDIIAVAPIMIAGNRALAGGRVVITTSKIREIMIDNSNQNILDIEPDDEASEFREIQKFKSRKMSLPFPRDESSMNRRWSP